jgi:uncharacterized protein YkwD
VSRPRPQAQDARVTSNCNRTHFQSHLSDSQTEMDRRAFLRGAAVSAVALRLGAAMPRMVSASAIVAPEFPAMTNHLLNQVNIERAEAGLTSLKLDRLACAVAEKHATEMARNNFISHWGLDGRKPYHRYSFAGGVEAIQENDSALNSSTPIALDEVPIHLMGLHRSMYEETPPNDGHRKTILNPTHTHVGFGYADYGFCVRLCELYVARYVAIDPYAVTASPRGRILLSGRLLEPTYSLEGIDVFYEPLPAPPDRDWLRIPRPYGLPDERESLRPKLGPNHFYEDRSKGSIEVQGRRFRAPMLLSRKEPGIYTAVVWIARSAKEEPFPATQVCVRAE